MAHVCVHIPMPTTTTIPPKPDPTDYADYTQQAPHPQLPLLMASSTSVRRRLHPSWAFPLAPCRAVERFLRAMWGSRRYMHEPDDLAGPGSGLRLLGILTVSASRAMIVSRTSIFRKDQPLLYRSFNGCLPSEKMVALPIRRPCTPLRDQYKCCLARLCAISTNVADLHNFILPTH